MKTYKYAYKPKGKGYTVYRTGRTRRKKKSSGTGFFGGLLVDAITGLFKALLK